MKRLLAGFLAVLMILPCLTVSASAKYQYIDYTRIYGGRQESKLDSMN